MNWEIQQITYNLTILGNNWTDFVLGAQIIRELCRQDISDNQKLIIVIRNWSKIKEHCNLWSKQDHPFGNIKINIKLKCDYNHIY